MAKPAVLVLTGYGINCDEETRYAFERAGAAARIVHINDIISSTSMLSEFQIAVFPGAFPMATTREAERRLPTA